MSETVESIETEVKKAKKKPEKLVGTPKELEAITGFNQVELSFLLNMAKKQGKAKVIRQIKKEGRGKPANVWEISKNLWISLAS
jgi:predicted transcriptional regulator